MHAEKCHHITYNRFTSQSRRFTLNIWTWTRKSCSLHGLFSKESESLDLNRKTLVIIHVPPTTIIDELANRDIIHDLVVAAQISLPRRDKVLSDSQDDNILLASASLRMPWGNQSTFRWDPPEPPNFSQSPSPNNGQDPFMAVEADWLMSLDFFGPNAFQYGLEHPPLFEGQVGNMIDITPASSLNNQQVVTNGLASINEYKST